MFLNLFFIEIKNASKKNLIIGCLYRHPSPPISEFQDNFLGKTLSKLTKTKKTCLLAGDFNVDLIKYGFQTGVQSFYDQVSAFGFRPLILQPSRVSSNSATLIDNIFINNMQTFSKGGNLTCSISDHFLQFCQLDLFDNPKKIKNETYSRNWRLFNNREFEDELKNIDWNEISDPNIDTNKSFALFFSKIEKLLDETAPVKKLTKK